MKKGLIMSFVIVALLASVSAMAAETTKETRNVTGFTKIGFGVAGDLYINIGSQFSVVLEGDGDLLKQIKTEVSGSKLVIKNESWHNFGNSRLTVYITMPALDGLGVSGSGKAEIKDALKCEDLDLSVSGSGRILAGELMIGKMDVGISGSGDVIINSNGEVRNAEISISGSGNYSGESLKIEDGEFAISGSGGCKCYVTGKLEASVSGSGNIVYSGNPKVDARVSGSGRVRSK
jgi:hypothetical protein